MPEMLNKNMPLTVWSATQPSAGANKDYSLPTDCKSVGVALIFPGTPPASIVLNIRGSNDGTNWVTVGSPLNSVAANTTATFDMSAFNQIRFNLATFTGPQNITVTATARF